NLSVAQSYFDAKGTAIMGGEEPSNQRMSGIMPSTSGSTRSSVISEAAASTSGSWTGGKPTTRAVVSVACMVMMSTSSASKTGKAGSTSAVSCGILSIGRTGGALP